MYGNGYSDYNWFKKKITDYDDMSGLYDIEQLYGVVGLLATNHAPTVKYTFLKHNVTFDNIVKAAPTLDFKVIKEVFDNIIDTNMVEPIRRFYKGLARVHKLKEFIEMIDNNEDVSILDPFCHKRIFYANQSNPIEYGILREIISEILIWDIGAYEHLHLRYFTTEEKKVDVMFSCLHTLKDMVDNGLGNNSCMVKLLTPVYDLLVRMRHSEFKVDPNGEYFDFMERLEVMQEETEFQHEMEYIRAAQPVDICIEAIETMVENFKTYFDYNYTWQPSFMIFIPMIQAILGEIEDTVNLKMSSVEDIRWMLVNYSTLDNINKIAACILFDRTTVIDGVVNMLVSDDIHKVEKLYSDMKMVVNRTKKKDLKIDLIEDTGGEDVAYVIFDKQQ